MAHNDPRALSRKPPALVLPTGSAPWKCSLLLYSAPGGQPGLPPWRRCPRWHRWQSWCASRPAAWPQPWRGRRRPAATAHQAGDRSSRRREKRAADRMVNGQWLMSLRRGTARHRRRSMHKHSEPAAPAWRAPAPPAAPAAPRPPQRRPPRLRHGGASLVAGSARLSWLATTRGADERGRHQ